MNVKKDRMMFVSTWQERNNQQATRCSRIFLIQILKTKYHLFFNFTAPVETGNLCFCSW